MTEKDLQRTILEFLQYEENKGNLYFFRSASNALPVVYKNKKGETQRSWARTGKAGCPDIVCCLKQNSAIGVKGLFVGLECKSAKGTQSLSQAIAQQAIEKAGGYYFVVRELKQVEDILKTLRR